MIIWNILCLSLVVLSLSLIPEVSSQGTVTHKAEGTHIKNISNIVVHLHKNSKF